MKSTILSSVRLVILSALVFVVSAAPAFAGGPLANCSSGVPFLWENGGVGIPFNPDQGDLGPLTNAGAVAAVQQAFDVWGAVPSSVASYVNAGPLPVDVDITNFGPYLNPVAPDGLSAIVFDDDGQIFDLLFGPGSGILGFAGPEWVNPATCEIFEGVSFLNGPSFTNLTAALDVMVHEFGHYSNLAHTVVNGQVLAFGDASGPTPNNTFGTPGTLTVIETMYPFYFGPGSGTQSLHADDIAMISTLYPDPGFFSNTGSISGTIYGVNGTTKLTGVNVIARNVADPFEDAVAAISSDFTDGTAQSDPVVGTYRINGLTPGADYAVFVDQILAGGFSTTPLSPLPGPEEFYNNDEANTNPPDDPSVFSAVAASAGANAAGTDIIFNGPSPGDPLAVGLDGSVLLFLPFAYEFCGVSYESVFVNANGNLTFGAPSSDFTESAADMLNGPPRIAGHWNDLNATQGGIVTFAESRNSFTVIWDGVPEFFATGSNSFQITLKKGSNHIDVDYFDMTAPDGLAGVSCGGLVTSRFEEGSDLSSFAPSRINLHNQPAVFEQFDGFSTVNDLADSTVRYNGTTNYNDNWAESNNSAFTARNVNLPFDSIPVTRYTEIEPTGGDVDFFAFDAEADTTLLAEVVTGGLDSMLALYQIEGRGRGRTATLIAVDDDGGAGLLSRLVVPITESGRYAVAVSTFADFDFDGNGNSGGRYVLDVSTIEGTILPLGDDDFEEVVLDFSFPFQGGSYSSVFVNSNGNLTFGSGDTDFSESITEFLNDQPRIAPLWDDLSPNQGGLVIVDGDASSFTVTFDSVPEFFSSSGNSFSVILRDDGTIDIDYGLISAPDSVVGVTDGGGAADPGANDLSSSPSWPALGTTYEQFTFGSPFDLGASALSFNP